MSHQPAHCELSKARIEIIDALRGFALLGILLIIIPWFALPETYSEAFRADPHSPNFWLRSFLVVLVEGKMRGMFGLFFGAGILLFTAAKEMNGLPARTLFYRRMAWLLIFGVIHAHVLLWPHEVLFEYAVAGMLLYMIRNVAARWLLLVFMPLAIVLDAGIFALGREHMRRAHLAYVATQANAGSPLTEQQQKAVANWKRYEAGFFPSRQRAQENLLKVKGTYASAASRARPIAWARETFLLPAMIWDPITVMVLGMALLKTGFFRRPRRLYAFFAISGYAIGLPLALLKLHHDIATVPNIEARFALLDAGVIDWPRMLLPVQRIALVMAHISLLILLLQSRRAAATAKCLAAIGRVALTTYIMYTVVCTLIFSGYGLNLCGELEYFQLYFIVGGIWLALIFGAPWWLARFRFGPLEWVWRCLTYGRMEPLLRARIEQPAVAA